MKPGGGFTLYLECANGASGDMLVAALLAASAAASDTTAANVLAAVVAPALDALGIDPGLVRVGTVVRAGLRAQHFTVDERPGFATFAELVTVARRSALADAVRDGVVAVAERMAAAEAAVHGTGVEHLDELAGLDTAVDLVSVLALVDHLAPARVIASPPALGGGRVHTKHGELPVPAPAVVELLRGLPTAGGEGSTAETGELTTPTGAALVAHLAREFGPLPPGRTIALGVGAGQRDPESRPNVLRAFVLETLDRAPHDRGSAVEPWSQDEVELLEATIDDLPAELLADAAARLLDAGALDVWSTPVVMKKSRPGVVLSVLARPAQRAALAEVLFRQTSTFGLRMLPARRLLLDERVVSVAAPELGLDAGAADAEAPVRGAIEAEAQTGGVEAAADSDGGTIRVRLGYLRGELITVSPEFEDCRRAAARVDRPLKDVYEAARAAARRLA